MSAKVEWSGRYVEAVKDGQWEYVRRRGDMEAAVILAVDEDDRVILVEQHRVPVGGRCLELPAGLVGDEDESETLEDAAIRELEEETGYRASAIERLGRFFASPGMTSEAFWLVRALGLAKVGDGGGDSAEEIEVHLVPRAEISSFVEAKRVAGVAVDVKMLVLLADCLASRTAPNA